jgi:hypothetical protein
MNETTSSAPIADEATMVSHEGRYGASNSVTPAVYTIRVMREIDFIQSAANSGHTANRPRSRDANSGENGFVPFRPIDSCRQFHFLTGDSSCQFPFAQVDRGTVFVNPMSIMLLLFDWNRDPIDRRRADSP